MIFVILNMESIVAGYFYLFYESEKSTAKRHTGTSVLMSSEMRLYVKRNIRLSWVPDEYSRVNY